MITNANDDFVHQTINVGPFERRLAAVHHQLCIATSEQHQTVAPSRVT
jgi:hypothetical protein